MSIDTSIFKAYDIRGIYPSSLDEDLAYKVGFSFAKLLVDENQGKELHVVVARDMRLSSPSLREKVVEGITDCGVNVVDIGLATTPTFYFGVSYYGYEGGIQISASHNPKEYNGFKMTRKNSVPISGENGIDKIRDMAVAGNFEKATEKGKVSKKENIQHEELEAQRKGIDWKKIKPFKIVVDSGNGMGTLDIEVLFADLPCTLIKLNERLDGNFPAHPPDPLKEENLTQIKEMVIKEKADLGIAVDGDADRWFFLDENGDVMPQPLLRGIMAQIAIKENPGAVVCYDIRPGKITKDLIEEAGGKAVVTRVGHSLIKETMIANNAVFGGESSGHYFYKFPYGTFEAPMVLVLKFLIYLSESGQTLSEIVKSFERYFHSSEINSEVKDKEGKLTEIKEKYKDGQISELDGVTIEYPDFWFNVRPSNTENLLRLNLEARTKEIMEAKKDEILSLIRS